MIIDKDYPTNINNLLATESIGGIYSYDSPTVSPLGFWWDGLIH